jgi:tRNA (guanine37-N1)-methyltransferase
MVMMCQPLVDAWQSLLPLPKQSRILMTSPLGKPFDQKTALELSQSPHLVILCGHYEGVDARILDLIPNLELISVGDYVLTGGELAALCIIDATTRLLPDALGKAESTYEESFMDGLLEYPQYTRPASFKGHEVPPILLSGNHGEIAKWRRKLSLFNTVRYRPELLKTEALSEEDKRLLNEAKAEFAVG